MGLDKKQAQAARRMAEKVAALCPERADAAWRCVYETFIESMAEDPYRYNFEATEAAKAMLGLPEKED